MRARGWLALCLAVAALAIGPAAAQAPTSSTATAAPRTAAAPPALTAAEVRLGDRRVFTLTSSGSALDAATRARRAQAALERAVEAGGAARAERVGTEQVIFVGALPIVALNAQDAAAAREPSLQVHAAAVVGRVEQAMERERRRAAISRVVFSFSLLVFSGLLCFLGVRKLGALMRRLRARVEAHETPMVLRIGGVDLVQPGSVRALSSLGLTVLGRLLQLTALYVWLGFAFSLFALTRGYTERLTALVLAPLSSLAGRVAGALPVLVLLGVGGLLLLLLLRFTELFFDNIARGETVVSWLSADLARPAGVLVRAGLVLVALAILAPLALPEGFAASWLFAALGFALVPLLANGSVGALVVFGRRFRAGDRVEIGGKCGVVERVGLHELRLREDSGAELRVPHLLCLLQAVRVERPAAQSLLVEVAPEAPQRVLAVLRQAGEAHGRTTVELVELGPEHGRYRVSVAAPVDPHTLSRSLSDGLARAGIALSAADRAP